MKLLSLKAGANPPTDAFGKDLEKNLDQFASRILEILNSGITFADNFNGQIVSVTTAATDTEVAVAHTLKRVPSDFFQGAPDKAASFYRSGTAWTNTTIYVKANAATVTAKLLIY